MFQSVLIAVRLSVVACFAAILALMVAPVRALAQQEHFDALANAPFSENREQVTQGRVAIPTGHADLSVGTD